MATPAPPLPAVPEPGGLSAKVTSKTDNAFAACLGEFKATSRDIAKNVSALANGCAKVANMKMVGSTIFGKGRDSDIPQTYLLKAEANHCYRVYGVSDTTARDLVFAIRDSTGAMAGQNDVAAPAAASESAACFKEDDAASVVVSVGMGAGAYALQIWRD